MIYRLGRSLVSYSRYTPIALLISMPIFLVSIALIISLIYAYQHHSILNVAHWMKSNGPSIALCGLIGASIHSILLVLFSKKFKQSLHKDVEP